MALRTSKSASVPRGSGRSGPALPRVAEDRIAKLQAAFGKAGVDADALLVTNPADVGYLSGFLGGDSYLIVGTGRSGRGKDAVRPALISDFRYEEELEPLKGRFEVVIRTTPIIQAAARLVKDRGIQRLGVQADSVTLEQAQLLRQHLGDGVSLVEVRGLVAHLRARKDASEVDAIRGAIKIQQAALKAVLPTLKPGLTELEVAAQLEAEMKTRGASCPAFETIVAARANGSLPHYRPAKVKLAKSQPLLIDWGAVAGGYRGDMTRTFSFGKWPAQVAEMYKIVLDAHLLAAEGLRAGTTTKAIDALARDYIAKHGYGERFGHGLGHGIGLATHEEPRLSHMGGDVPLEAGMVVTIEPGIYVPGVGGVRIEDDYVVTAKGSENLCSLPKDIKWATL